MTKLRFYTDGACRVNKVGSWACVVVEDDKEESRIVNKSNSYVVGTTNNEMELFAGLIAVTKALNMVRRSNGLHGYNKYEKIDIYSDSRHFVNGVNDMWLDKWKERDYINAQGEEVRNLTIWRQIIGKIRVMRRMFDVDLEIHWVKAHNGNVYNEMADELTNEAIEDYYRQSQA